MARRWRVVALVAALTLGASCSSCSSGASSGELDENEPAASAAVPSGDVADLPIGTATDPYRVTHVVPKGYRMVSAQEIDQTSYLPFGPSHVTTYHDGHGDDGDANLSVWTTRKLRYPAERFGRATTDVDGHDAWATRVRDDGRYAGNALFWKADGMWIGVLAALPLTAKDTERVAAGVEPFPSNRWKALASATDHDGYRTGRPANIVTRSVGAGTVGGKRWRLATILPRDWGELSVERRPACWAFTFGGRTRRLTERCAQSPEVFVVGDVRFVVGQVPARTRKVDLLELQPDETDAGRKVATTLLPVLARGPKVRFWVAVVPSGWCLYRARATPSKDPAGTFDEIVPFMDDPISGKGAGTRDQSC